MWRQVNLEDRLGPVRVLVDHIPAPDDGLVDQHLLEAVLEEALRAKLTWLVLLGVGEVIVAKIGSRMRKGGFQSGGMITSRHAQAACRSVGS